MTANPTVPHRLLTAELRWAFLALGLLAFPLAIPLTVFTDDTDRYFAWTINPALTAAFLGAGYWSATFLFLLAWRKHLWAEARLSATSGFIFTSLTLLATLLHLDRFHTGRVITWAWIGIYAAVPPVLAALVVLQLRTPGGRDPARAQPLRRWVRLVLAAQAAVFVPLGALLYVLPDQINNAWPWLLTPLTARAVAAWVLALGIGAAHALWENDWMRLGPAAVSFFLYGVFQAIALARYTATVDWGDGRTWAYVAALATITVVGLEGIRATAPSLLVRGSAG